MAFVLIALLFLAAAPCLSYNILTEQDAVAKSYDFVMVGGGAAVGFHSFST